MDIAAIYIRLSKEDREKPEEESESIQNQRRILDAYAEKQNWKVFDRYVDEDWSGSDRSRPEFHRMIEDARAGKFNIVLVKTQSRFARDSKYIEDYIHNLFAEKGIRFVSVVDNIDTCQRGSRLNSRVHAIFDEEQLELLSSNIRQSFEEKAKQGQFFGSMPPYGYKKDPQNKNHLIIDEEAAQNVRLIFEMTAAGASYKAVAKRLNDMGAPIPSEYKRRQGYRVDGMYSAPIGKWTRDTVRSFLSNEVYRGTVVNHKSTVVNFRTKKKRAVASEERIRIEHMHEAIIDDMLWDRVQELRKSRTKASSNAGAKHPLSGRVICGECGAKMYKCKSGGIEYFRCYRASAAGECENNKRVRIDELEEIILKQLNTVLEKYGNSEYIAANIKLDDRRKRRLAECEKRRDALKKEFDEKKRAMKRLLTEYMNDVVEKSIYEEAQRGYLKEREECRRRLEAAEAESEKIRREMPEISREQVLEKYRSLNKLTLSAVQSFIESVVVSEPREGCRDIEIRLKV
ncbi:MAG: recombinase family protein [Clostridiales bacterium]|nr:recombinase family protein [Clostridiales bacterium]